MDKNSTEASKIDKIEESEMLNKEEANSKGISYSTVGTILQALSVQLDEGESIYSESGKMSWMTQNIDMKTRGRGIGKMISRIFTGESLFLNYFKSEKGTGVVTFSTDQAGKVVPVDLSKDSLPVMFQKGAFLCAEESIDLSIAFTKRISAGLFGGNGFIMQKVEGGGRAHLIADGEVVMYELEEGDEISVDQGNLLAYEESVDFDIQTVKGGAMNWLFGGEGIFLAVLRGPGKVWLQTRKLHVAGAAAASASGGQGAGGTQNPLGCIIGIIMSILGFVFVIAISLMSI